MEPIWGTTRYYDLQTALQAHMQGDTYATEWLYAQMQQYRPRLLHIAQRKVEPNAAEDLIQETFLTALTPNQIHVLAQWGAEADLYIHLCKILHGKISTYLRYAHCRHRQESLENLNPKDHQAYTTLCPDPISQIQDEDFRRMFWLAIDQCLTPEEKLIFKLRYLRKLGWNDIEKILHISSAALRQRDMRIRQKLRNWKPLAQLCRDYGFLLDSDNDT